jgi:hypothetical protein
MAAVKSLTTRGILLDAGSLALSGTSEQIIQHYTELTTSPKTGQARRGWGKGLHTAIIEAHLLDKDCQPTTRYIPGEPFRIEAVVETDGSRGLSLELFLTDASRVRVGFVSTYQFHGQTLPEKKGRYRLMIKLDALWLASGNYGFDVATSVVNANWDHTVESAIEFDVQFSNALGYPWDFRQSYGYGPLTLLCNPVTEFQPVCDSEVDCLTANTSGISSAKSMADAKLRPEDV